MLLSYYNSEACFHNAGLTPLGRVEEINRVWRYGNWERFEGEEGLTLTPNLHPLPKEKKGSNSNLSFSFLFYQV